ncbi:hypothetical protein EDC01DRAFT_431402 [Geopyxis carbonaria]|nr:hypothetical protein EDC01DRAFT_431402 [Geopyxis carbonaria]
MRSVDSTIQQPRARTELWRRWRQRIHTLHTAHAPTSPTCSSLPDANAHKKNDSRNVCLYLYLLHTSALTFNRGYELFRPSPCTSFALQHRAEKVQHHQIHPLAVRCVFSCLDHQAFHLPSCLPAFLPSCLIARARAGGTLSAASNSRTRAIFADVLFVHSGTVRLSAPRSSSARRWAWIAL